MSLHAIKKQILENLSIIQSTLDQCVEDGMLDQEAQYHNDLLILMDDVHVVTTLPALNEVMTKAKTLEVDLAAWLAGRGRTTLSLSWPQATNT
jgi:hypothetical protein